MMLEINGSLLIPTPLVDFSGPLVRTTWISTAYVHVLPATLLRSGHDPLVPASAAKHLSCRTTYQGDAQIGHRPSFAHKPEAIETDRWIPARHRRRYSTRNQTRLAA